MSITITPKKKPWEVPLDRESAAKVRPDPKKVLAENDPIEYIQRGLSERGFENLWTTYPTRTKPLTGFSDRVKLAFLRQYSVTGRMAYSAAACGISAFTVNVYARGDPVFREAVEEARAYFRDLLSGELYRRGVEGFYEGVVGGRNRDEVIMVKKYSDKSLELLARIHMPELQKQAKEEKQVALQPTVVNNQFNFSNLNPEDLSMAKKLLENQSKIIEGEIVDESNGE